MTVTDLYFFNRIRQAYSAGGKVHVSASGRVSRVLGAPSQGGMRRGQHADSVARASNRRLLVPHVYGDSMAARQAELQPYILHPVLDCHAEQ